jgi:hypothetical protein
MLAFPSKCENWFRFKANQLGRLFTVWRIPLTCQLENRSVYPGEQVMLLALRRLVFPVRLDDMTGNEHDQSAGFGREYTQASRAFKWFVNHLYSTFLDLLTNNLEWWMKHAARFANSVQRKMEQLGYGFPAGVVNTVAWFIDCVQRRSCRPGGGPGPFGSRNHNDIQRAFYNGWKKCWGLKFQTVDAPCGMTIDMFGPETLRHNDLYVLRESRINARLAAAQAGRPVQYKMYGDDIYVILSHLIVSWPPGGTPVQVRRNEVMKQLRIEIEWDYGHTAGILGYIDWRKNNKILAGGSNMAKVYIVGTFIRNCFVTLNGSLSAEYFQCQPPTLEEYVNQL